MKSNNTRSAKHGWAVCMGLACFILSVAAFYGVADDKLDVLGIIVGLILWEAMGAFTNEARKTKPEEGGGERE